MEDICKNCEYFALMCPAGDECLWGVCKKPVADMEEMNGDSGDRWKIEELRIG